MISVGFVAVLLVTLIQMDQLQQHFLGGFILLIVHTACKHLLNMPLYESGILEILTYHGLGLGFAAMALRTVDKKADNRSKTGALDTGLAVVNGYLKDVPVELVKGYEADLYAYMDEYGLGVLENIRTTGQLSKEDEESLKQALADFTAKFLALK